MNKRIAVYGTLRRGGWNHPAINKEPEFSTIMTGYVLGYSYLPFCEETGDDNDTTLFEMYEIDEKTFNRIDLMEISAGYKRKTLMASGQEWIWWEHEIPNGATVATDYIGEINGT